MSFESKSYIENEVVNLDRDELIAFIYSGTLKYLDEIKESVRNGDIEGRVEKVNKVINIISYLRSILDFEKGGIIAKNLDSLYLFSTKELSEFNLTNDIKKLEAVENIFKELSTTWREMIRKKKSENKEITKNTSPSVSSIEHNKEKRLEIYG